MEILFCNLCNDCFALNNQERTCKCESSMGLIKDDDLVFYTGEHAIPMTIPLENLKGLIDFFPNNNAIKISSKDRNQELKIFCGTVIDYLNEQAGTSYSKKYPSAICTSIIERKKECNCTIEDFKAVIDKKVAHWKGTDHEKFLVPSTLFAKKHFINYLGQIANVKQGNTSSFRKFVDSVNAAKE